MDDFEKELKEDFLEESLQLLEDCEQAFLELENDNDDTELLDQIFRLAHNLKGTSRAVGFGQVAEFTHEMENLILKLKTGEMQVNDTVVSLLLECNDHITYMINSLRADLDATFDSTDIIAKIIGVISGDVISEEVKEPEFSATPIEVTQEYIEPETTGIPDATAFDDDSFESEDDIESVVAEEEKVTAEKTPISAGAIETLRKMGVDVDALYGDQLNVKVEETPKIDEGLTVKKGDEVVSQVAVDNVVPIEAGKKVEAKKSAKKAAPKKSEDESIRVALSRVEKLNNVVGELVILQTVLDERRFSAIHDELANKSIAQLGKLSKEIQEISMSLRMIPLKGTFQKMNRIVRDTSKTLDKKVKLHLIGEDTEIDKTVLEHLADPLVHIIRNAVDHGLESTEDRIRCGKSEEGNVELKAYHEGNNLIIEIIDDGGGIPADIIKAKAIEKGLLNPNKEISDEDIIQYIFAPGFSTKEEVTEVSGRGVGMDVVKTNIEKMSGAIKVTTKAGVGSVFKVCLPLTMAIIDGMIVRIGKEKYIIPLSQVHESLRPSEGMLNTITGFGQCLNLRGEVLPLFSISKTLGRKQDEGGVTDKIAIIVHHSDFNYAVLVDDILHQQQVVIKSVGEEIKSRQGFMGSSILGDGRPSFILDLNELYSKSLKKNPNNFKENIEKVA